MRTSKTHPLRLDGMDVGRGRLSLTICPGKKGSSIFGGMWDRDLATDAARLRALGADMVVSLIEEDEGDRLGVPDLGPAIEAAGMGWERFPIRDVSVPRPEERLAVDALLDRISAALDAGRHVVVHCQGGLGRAGTVAAAILVRRGTTPPVAIAQVRRARNGAIETPEQERYVAELRPAL